jgi:WD40 repeat protein
MLDLGAAGDRLGVALASGARWTLDPAVGTVGVGVTVGAGNSVVPVSSTVEAPDPLTTIRSLANGLSPTTAEVRTPDGALLVTAGTDGRLRVWELATLSLRATFLAMSDGSWIVDRPDGTRFASDSLRDGTSPVLYRAPRK